MTPNLVGTMAPPHKNGFDTEEPGSIWNGHENRIQRVETAIGTANVSLERVETNLKNVTDTVTQGFQTLNNKMDLASAQNESIETKVDGLTPRIEHLEKVNKQRGDRKIAVRNTIGGLAIAGAGAVVAKFGESVALFFTHLFGR